MLSPVIEHRWPELTKETPHVFGGMLGSSAPMQVLFRQIERVGRSDATVLICGESGTGKELVARAVHDSSSRRNKPFIALNCSALPAELVESELFGHVRGSFTGAISDHAGLFQAAHGGTLFLDEIGDLAVATQSKVLRALENGEILRVGSTQITRVDVRVIAATHRPLQQMVANGQFRPDLFFRLKVVQLVVPPLRERRQDIPQLVHHFLKTTSHVRPGILELDDGVMHTLQSYDWPGNVRELRNMISGAVVMADDDRPLQSQDFPIATDGGVDTMPAPDDSSDGTAISERLAHLPFAEARARALEDFDRSFLTAALARHSGNIARTARSLGLHRQSLQKLMARRGIKSVRPTPPSSPAV